MPLIEKVVGPEDVNKKIKVSGETWDDIEKYLEFAKLGDDIDLFFEESAKMVLKKDKEFLKWKKDIAKAQKEPEESHT